MVTENIIIFIENCSIVTEENMLKNDLNGANSGKILIFNSIYPFQETGCCSLFLFLGASILHVKVLTGNILQLTFE